MKKILTLIIAALLAGAAVASSVALRPNHPQRYVVVKGDTLWDIAAKFLKNPWQWPNIWYVNPQIKNPHLIYPGDTLTLVWVDGKPQIRVKRGRPTVKLSPRARPIPLDKAIPTIPLSAIGPFLNRTRIVSKEELARAPYIVSNADHRVIAGANDRIYVRGIKRPQGQYAVVRQGSAYIDPVTKEVLGYEATYVGTASLQRPGDPATLRLLDTTRETLMGDRLLESTGKEFNPTFLPHAPKRKVNGQIISVLDGVSQIGQHQVVVINRGRREGMQVGHVLAVYQKGEVIADQVTPDRKDTVKLPDERAGLIMVFRTFDKVSYALVMRATRAMHVLDYVRNP